MGYNRLYHQNYKAREKIINDTLGPRYRSDEAKPGETFREFQKRITKEEIEKVQEQAREIYPAWIKMPGESDEQFKKRLVSVNPNNPPKYPAWKKAPNETEQQFKKRFTAKS